MKLSTLIMGVALTAGLWLGTVTAYADQLASIQQKRGLKAAVPQDVPSLCSLGTDRKPHGNDIDMAAYLAGQLEVE